MTGGVMPTVFLQVRENWKSSGNLICHGIEGKCKITWKVEEK